MRYTPYGAVLVLITAIVSACVWGQTGTDEAGVWQLEEITVSHPSTKEVASRYPWNCKGTNGDTTSEVGIGHLNPPGRQKVRLTWTDPPNTLTPGETVSLVLNGEMLVNDTRGRAYLGCDFSADIEAVDMPDSNVSREGRVKFADARTDRIVLNENTTRGTAVQLKAQATAPALGAFKSRETGKIQVRLMIHHLYPLVYHYVYKWVPRPKKAEEVAKVNATPLRPTAGPAAAPSPTAPAPSGTARPMSGGFPKKDLPAAIEEESRSVTAQGGALQLPSGAKLTIPAGALKQEDRITFRRLPSPNKDTGLYHIESSVGSLAAPAELELPLPIIPPADKEHGVLVLLFHNESDPGQLLPVEYKKGASFVKAKTQETSVIAVTIIWGAVIGAVGSEGYMRIVNSDDRLLQAIAAGKAASKDPSVLFRVPYYCQDKTLWCWATCLSMAAHAVLGTTKQLERPQKPQVIASVVGADTGSGLGAWRFWIGNSCQPFAYLHELTGAEVEVFRWIHYEDLIKYIFENVAKRYPVVVDIQAHTHSIVVVGYDADGFWVHDPSIPDVPVGHIPWVAFCGIIRETSTQLVRGVNTTVIKSKVDDASNSVVSLNIPSCKHGGQVGVETNRFGCYFTTPHFKGKDFSHGEITQEPAGPPSVVSTYGPEDDPAFQHTAFAWNGFCPESQGVRLVTGPKGVVPIDILEVGARTAFGFRGIEISNVSDAEVQCAMKVVLVDPADKQEAIVVEGTPYAVPGKTSGAESYLDKGYGGRLLCSSKVDTSLLSVLPAEKRGVRNYVLRFSLLEGGKEVDRVNLPLTLNPLRIDNVIATASGEARNYDLTGSGFEMKGLQVFLVMGPNRHVPMSSLDVQPMSKLSVKDFQSASFALPAKLQPQAIYLVAANGLESNAYPIVGQPFQLKLQHEGGATLGPGDNVLKITCNGMVTGPPGTTAAARSQFMHNAQLLDVYASTRWEEPFQISLNVQYNLSLGTKWRWDCTIPGHNGLAFGQTILSNPRLEVIPNAPQHASCKSTQTPPVLDLFVPPGGRLAALTGTGNVPQQFSGLVALVFDKTVRMYRVVVELKKGEEPKTTNVFDQAATDTFVKDQGSTAKIYLLHFQVDRNP